MSTWKVNFHWIYIQNSLQTRIRVLFNSYFIDGNKKERGNKEKTQIASNGIDGKMLY